VLASAAGDVATKAAVAASARCRCSQP
jgi:hypothetical protein